MAFSAKTLFNGDNLGLQTYSVVRVYSITLQRWWWTFSIAVAFENFNASTRKELNEPDREVPRWCNRSWGPADREFLPSNALNRILYKKTVSISIYIWNHISLPKHSSLNWKDRKGDEADKTEWASKYEQEK